MVKRICRKPIGRFARTPCRNAKTSRGCRWQSARYDSSLVFLNLAFSVPGLSLSSWCGVFWFARCLYICDELMEQETHRSGMTAFTRNAIPHQAAKHSGHTIWLHQCRDSVCSGTRMSNVSRLQVSAFRFATCSPLAPIQVTI